MTIEDAIRILDPETTKEELEKRCERGDYLREYEVKFYAGKLAADELRKRQWISVKDRLPERDGEYLIHLDDGFIATASYMANEDGELDWELWADSGEVTHWQPLPEPPKKI